MAKRKISKKTILAAIRSPKTPEGFKKGLKKFAKRKGWL